MNEEDLEIFIPRGVQCPHCPYYGKMKPALEPRPSSKKTVICPSCLEIVK